MDKIIHIPKICCSFTKEIIPLGTSLIINSLFAASIVANILSFIQSSYAGISKQASTCHLSISKQ